MDYFNAKNRRLMQLPQLVAFYIAIIILYALLPESLELVKRVLSPLLLVTLAVIFAVSLGSLRRR